MNYRVLYKMDADYIDEYEDAEDVVEEPVYESDADSADEDSAEELPGEEEPLKYRTIVIRDDDRKTSDTMSYFEMVEIVSIRSSQIEKNRNCMVDVSDLTDPISMAKRELAMRLCPLLIRRKVGTDRGAGGSVIVYVEFWNPNEMTFDASWQK